MKIIGICEDAADHADVRRLTQGDENITIDITKYHQAMIFEYYDLKDLRIYTITKERQLRR
eukprot:TRINITY_DN13854_c0_g1_i1.p1 TRINITY_DN13854_c0_g1~~TRINITY_DN13854_c0_g1_i1.p1  ORF type:complete len:61 (-),score=13.35 TRINITY_DN13854_c0_g1_i1:126-308(-)